MSCESELIRMGERVRELSAEMRRLIRLALAGFPSGELITCGCGDLRPIWEFCPTCGQCQIGGCMCEVSHE